MHAGIAHAATLTLSGTLYSDEGTTPITALVPLKIAIGTSTLSVSATTSLATGAWNIIIPDGHTISTSTPILIWTDATTSIRAALFTKASSSVNDIPNLSLYQNRVIFSHEGVNGTSTTLTDLSFYDSDDDVDIQYNATTTGAGLSVYTGNELYIKTGKTFAPGGPVTVHGNASASTTDGSLRLTANSTYIVGGLTTLGGNFTASSSATLTATNTPTFLFTATTTGKSIAASLPNLGALAFNGIGGGWTIATTSTTTTVTVTNGTFIAPGSTLALNSFSNTGTFTHNSGTLFFNGSTTRFIGGDAVNFSWAITTNELVWTVTSHNGKLYAGIGSTAGDAEVWEYNGSTWTLIGGDAVNSSWAVSTYESVYTLTSHNGKLYAGLGSTAGDAEVWEYNGSIWTKIGGDTLNSSWANSTYEYVYTLTSHNGKLYAGLGSTAGDAEVWEYNGSAWARVGGDAVNSSWANSTYESVNTLSSHNGKLYAGLGSSAGDAEVWEYNGATWTLVGGDAVNSSWADSTYERVWSLVSHNGKLYAGLGQSTGDAEVWEYNGATWARIGGDAVNSSWADATYEGVFALTSHNNKLYAGLGNSIAGDAEVWEIGDTVTGIATGTSALGSVTVGGNLTFMNNMASTTNLTIGSTGTVTIPTILSIAGNYLNSGVFMQGYNGTIIFNGTSPQTLGGSMTGVSGFSSTTFRGSGSKTFTSNASTTNFTIESTSGFIVAPTALSISQNYTNNSTFTHNSGMLYLSGNIASSTLVGGDAVNSSWADASYESVYSLTSHNGKLYAGIGQSTGDAEVWEYNGATWTLVGGDAVNSSWADGVYDIVYTLTSHNGKLYAGLGLTTGEAEVWEYNGATWTLVGGDALNSSWAVSTYEIVWTLTSHDGKLYAGLGSGTGDAEVWEYNGSTWTLVGGDTVNSSWVNSTYENVYTLTSYDGKLYAGLGLTNSDAEVWEYNGSTWTLVGGDAVNSSWAVSTYESVNSLIVHDGKLYAGLGQSTGDAEVWEYNGATWTLVGGDAVNSSWADGAYELAYTLTSHNGKLYAGLGTSAGEAEVWEYNGSIWTKVGGDTLNSSWADSTYERVYSLTSHSGKLYAGLGQSAGDAEVWEFQPPVASGALTDTSAFNTLIVDGSSRIISNASTTDLVITASSSLTAPTHLSISGYYENHGVFTAGSGTTTFMGGTGLATKVGGDALNSSWADSTYEWVSHLTSHNGILYAGLGTDTGDAEVWSYNESTWTKVGGDTLNSSWANSTYENVSSLTSHNGVLYAGLASDQGDAEVWSYNGSTWARVGGDAVNSSWANSTYENVSSLTSHNGVLYAGLGDSTGDAEVWSYNGSTWTKVGGDDVNSSWADATYEWGYRLTSHNGLLYAGLGNSGGDAEVWSYNGSTWTKVGGDNVNSSWNNFSYDLVFSLTSHKGLLYAGLGFNTGDAEVWSYNGSTWTKVGGDDVNSSWATSTYERVQSLVSHNGLLYAGLGASTGDAEVWSYNGSTWTKVGGDDVNSSWADATYEYVYSLTSHNGTLYAGLGLTAGDAEVWAFPTPTLSGILTGDSALSNFNLRDGARIFSNNASTTNFTIGIYATVTTPTLLSISGNYQNSGTYLVATTSTTTFNGSSAQGISGTATSTSAFTNLTFIGAGTKTFNNAASSTNFVIETGATVVAPATALSISGSYTNNGTFTHNNGTTTFSGITDQTISGIATNTSAFAHVTFAGSSTKTFLANASTSNFTIGQGATVTAPTLLSIAGNYTNAGRFVAGTGTTTFNGTSMQTATGTMTGTSAFRNLTIVNTSGAGSTSQSIVFGAPASTTENFTMIGSTSAQFRAGATSTFTNISLQGIAGEPIFLRSSVNGTGWGLVVPGAQRQVTYVNVRDSQACSGNPNIATNDGMSQDAGNNTCWDFTAPAVSTIASEANQVFVLNQSDTPLSTVTVTDGTTPSITTANDIRIKIATSTVRMLFDTTDTTATFGGTASAKVSNPVTYEGNGSVLVIPVSNDFSASDTLTISGLAFTSFTATNTAATALRLYTDGAGDISENATDSRTVTITGSLTLADHTVGQVSDAFLYTNHTGLELFRSRLTPAGEPMTITTTIFILEGVSGVTSSDLTNFALFKDNNSDGIYDVGDTQIGGSGVVSITEQTGTITFSTPYNATTSYNYILVGDVANLGFGEFLTIKERTTSITATGDLTSEVITLSGAVSSVQHMRGGYGGGGGSSGAVGGAAPAGAGVTTGGTSGGGNVVDSNTGSTIGNEVGFNAPGGNGSPQGAWTGGANAYASDGVYTTSSVASALHTYSLFGFNVPSNNTVTGIEVKIEASASPTAAGNLSVTLSWNGGTNSTAGKTTSTMDLTDAVFTLGGSSDTWGHSWTPSELENGNFTVDIVSGANGSTIQVDAIQVRVYHQATGGGGGGGGAVYKGQSQYFANIYSSALRYILEGIWDTVQKIVK